MKTIHLNGIASRGRETRLEPVAKAPAYFEESALRCQHEVRRSILRKLIGHLRNTPLGIGKVC